MKVKHIASEHFVRSIEALTMELIQSQQYTNRALRLTH